MVAAACLAAATGQAGAEEAVGLEAQGVDPWAALLNPHRLDVRDELGRPVSARLIERQLKLGQASGAERASYASRLPQAKAVIRALELLERVEAGLRAGFPAFPWRRLWALPPPSRCGQKSSPLGFAAVVLLLLAAALPSKTGSLCRRADTGACSVLRC